MSGTFKQNEKQGFPSLQGRIGRSGGDAVFQDENRLPLKIMIVFCSFRR